jgi:hypothetical protein
MEFIWYYYESIIHLETNMIFFKGYPAPNNIAKTFAKTLF